MYFFFVYEDQKDEEGTVVSTKGQNTGTGRQLAGETKAWGNLNEGGIQSN